jgi:hypothetical protein
MTVSSHDPAAETGSPLAIETPTSIYKYYDRQDILVYVGITSRGVARNREHNADKEWWPYVCRQEVEHRPTRALALAREKQLIMAHRPPFNVQHNPDAGSLREIYLTYVRNGQPQNEAQEEIFERLNGKLPLAALPVGTSRRLVLRTHLDHEPLARLITLTAPYFPKVFAQHCAVSRVTELERKGPYTRLILPEGRRVPLHTRFGIAQLRKLPGKKPAYRIHNVLVAVGDETAWWENC